MVAANGGDARVMHHAATRLRRYRQLFELRKITIAFSQKHNVRNGGERADLFHRALD